MPARTQLLLAALLPSLAGLALASPAEAHADHYSQAAFVTVSPDGARVELDLSPGALVASQVVSAVDSDGDGELSENEQRAYAGALLRDLSLQIDGEPLALGVASMAVPPASHLRTGEDKMTLTLAAALPELSPGPHRMTFRNVHQPVKSVHQANAVGGNKAITIGKQSRDASQEELAADFVVAGTPATEKTRPWPFFVLGALFCASFALVLSGRKTSAA